MAKTPTARAGRAAARPRERDVPGRLLEVATQLFAKQGFESTSVQAIVEAAGLTKGAMYHYFSSKDDLLYEIYGRVLRLQTANLERIAATDQPVASRVHQASADVVETSIANINDTVIFFRSMHQLHPEKQRLVRAERRRYHVTFRALVEEGQRSGAFRSDVPADLVVDYFFGAVHHLGTWYRKRGPLKGADVGRYYADLLIQSLRPS